jgi:drug/metabolite transporter (DMT)-like permease
MIESSKSILPGGADRTVVAARDRVLVLLAFLCIYLIWGSTYLAIRYAVETIPPLFVAGLRHLIAGGFLFGWCWWRGLRPTRQQWFSSVVLGVLFFLIGHGTLHWAQQNLPSGLAALLVATEPIWIAVMVAMTRRGRITPSLVSGIVLGTIGVGLLIGADMKAGTRELVSSIAVLVGALSWSVGMMYSRTSTLHPNAIMAAAMSLFAGGILLLLAGVVTGEAAGLDSRGVSAKSLLALGYLTIMGSLIAYSAYFWLLDRCSPTLIATHTYVNPVVALILGWAFAGETLTGRLVLAGAAVVAAIFLVGRATRGDVQSSERRRRIEGDVDALEQGAA